MAWVCVGVWIVGFAVFRPWNTWQLGTMAAAMASEANALASEVGSSRSWSSQKGVQRKLRVERRKLRVSKRGACALNAASQQQHLHLRALKGALRPMVRATANPTA